MLDLQFDLFQSLIIATIIIGLVFSILLWQKKENRRANRFLSLLIFSICFSLGTQLWMIALA